MNVVIDIGNSKIKAAVFKDGQIIEVISLADRDPRSLDRLLSSYPISKGICSSVGEDPHEYLSYLGTKGIDAIRLDHQTPLPITHLYQTPHTLGMDRLAAVIGGRTLHPAVAPLLVIDAGSAITYDLLDAQNVFQGGNISIGLALRCRALSDYTARLPLVTHQDYDGSLLGRNTQTALLSGVVNGVLYEIKGTIDKIKDQYPDLFVFLTGGDADFLSKNLKSCIFAEANLVLIGLNRIIQHNVQIR